MAISGAMADDKKRLTDAKTCRWIQMISIHRKKRPAFFGH
jgi:hypothetical protein